MNLNSPEKKSNSRSPIKLATSAESDDLEMKLEVDKFNDIKNIMYLRGKIITDTKKNLPMRTDFKKLMKEKNETELMAEKQRKEMASMVAEFEK